MSFITTVRETMSSRERTGFIVAASVFTASLIGFIALTIQTNSSYVPVRGGSYREGIIGQPILINPAVSKNQADLDISALVFSPLSTLASSIEKKADGLTYVVKLKEDLTWDDGEPLTSDDVVFTIETIQNPASQSPVSKNWNGVSVERVSELQVSLTLPSRYGFFGEIVDKLQVIPKHAFKSIPVENFRLSSYSLKPIGNGPYLIKDMSQRTDGFITEYHLVPNPRYAGEEPYISHFFFRFYENRSDLIDDFRSKKLDAFGSFSPVEQDLAGTSKTVVDRIPSPRYYAVFLNPANNPAFRKAEVRKALSLAIDRKALAEALGESNAFPITGPIVPLTEDERDTATKPLFDAERARSLLESAKVGSLKLNLVIPDTATFKEVADFLRESWAAIGIQEINIFPTNSNEILGSVVNTRNYDMVLFGNALEHRFDLYPFWHSAERTAPGLNLSFYQNTAVDRAIETARQSDDKNIQELNARKAADTISADSPALFLFTTPYFYAHADKLQGASEISITSPEGRFSNIDQWSVTKARIVK